MINKTMLMLLFLGIILIIIGVISKGWLGLGVEGIGAFISGFSLVNLNKQ